VPQASTTGIPLIEICKINYYLLLCNNFNGALTDLAFSISNLVNLLFYERNSLNNAWSIANSLELNLDMTAQIAFWYLQQIKLMILIIENLYKFSKLKFKFCVTQQQVTNKYCQALTPELISIYKNWRTLIKLATYNISKELYTFTRELKAENHKEIYQQSR